MSDVSDMLTGVMSAHQKQHKKTKKEEPSEKTVKRRAIVMPTENLDPENEKIRVTVAKLCKYVEFLVDEVKDLRIEIDSKADFTDTNSLSIKLDQVENRVDDLARVMED